MIEPRFDLLNLIDVDDIIAVTAKEHLFRQTLFKLDQTKMAGIRLARQGNEKNFSFLCIDQADIFRRNEFDLVAFIDGKTPGITGSAAVNSCFGSSFLQRSFFFI
mgnify:FL=1